MAAVRLTVLCCMQNVWKKTINRDQWNMFYDFSQAFKTLADLKKFGTDGTPLTVPCCLFICLFDVMVCACD